MRILVAEDDPMSRRILSRLLADWGYDVVLARDGAEALDVLWGHDPPALALIGWLLPAVDGLEVCRSVRSRRSSAYAYVIMVTGRSEKADLVQALEAGADDYVTKPYDEQELRVRTNAGRRIVDMAEVLRRQANHDALTGVRSRWAIEAALESEAARCCRDGGSVGVLMADLDHFKRINDDHGHLAGDRVLKEACGRMAGAVRSYDTLGRYGGEEFLVVLPSSDRSHARLVAERLREAVAAEPFRVPHGEIPVTVSLGASAAEGAAALPGFRLVQAADEALYRAKRAGRNRVEVA